MTRIFLILAHTLTRAGLRNCLAGNTDLQVVGDAPDASSGWPQVTQLRPDLIVLDGAALNALHASGRFPSDSDKSPAPTLVLFTDNEAMEQTDSALQAGVRGFLDTATTPEALTAALRRVAAGERYVSPALLPRLTPEAGVPEMPETNPESLLSARELEVVILTAGGLESKEIGDRLGISPRTVDVHRAYIR
ncbi:MAG: LuxR C-terminal-related transcriptional regulator, partial [Limisphaerales bacterium]